MALVDKLADINGLYWSRSFPRNSVSRWTKSGPCVDRLMLGMQNDQLAGVSKIGLGALKYDPKEATVLGAIEHQYQWAEAQGKIGKRFHEFAGSVEEKMSIPLQGGCPGCNMHRCKKYWRPSQWHANFGLGAPCDRLLETVQGVRR